MGNCTSNSAPENLSGAMLPQRPVTQDKSSVDFISQQSPSPVGSQVDDDDQADNEHNNNNNNNNTAPAAASTTTLTAQPETTETVDAVPLENQTADEPANTSPATTTLTDSAKPIPSSTTDDTSGGALAMTAATPTTQSEVPPTTEHINAEVAEQDADKATELSRQNSASYSRSYLYPVEFDTAAPHPIAHAAHTTVTSDIIQQTSIQAKKQGLPVPFYSLPSPFLSDIPLHSLRGAIHRVLAERRLWQRLGSQLDQAEEIDLLQKVDLARSLDQSSDTSAAAATTTSSTTTTTTTTQTSAGEQTTNNNNNNTAPTTSPNAAPISASTLLDAPDQHTTTTTTPAPAPAASTTTSSSHRSSDQKHRKTGSSLYRNYQKHCNELKMSPHDMYAETATHRDHFLWQLSHAQHQARQAIPAQPSNNGILQRNGRQLDIANVTPLTDDTPLTHEWILSMIDELRSGKMLSFNDAFQILRRAAATLLPEANCVTVKIPRGRNCTVIGDLHGQLDDLLMIFREIDFPNLSGYMLFNGDFVDRGAYSCEVVLTILAFRALYPQNVFMNRGNHECSDMNAMDGFQRECDFKYSSQLYWFFNCTFATLPIAHVIQVAHQRVFVVHAGLSFDDISISDINQENRFLVTFPMSSILQDLIWSDPFDGMGRQVSRRGAGCQFGIDVVQRFLIRNNIHLIIRSHECEDNGFALWFENRLYTIFSASDYCGDSNNYGAFCVLSNAPAPQIRVYMAKKQVVKYSERVLRIRQALLTKLLSRIVSKIFVLEQKMNELSEKRGTPGKLPLYAWSYVMSTVLSIDIPYIRLAKKLGVNVNADGTISVQPNAVPVLTPRAATASLDDRPAVAAPQTAECLSSAVALPAAAVSVSPTEVQSNLTMTSNMPPVASLLDGKVMIDVGLWTQRFKPKHVSENDLRGQIAALLFDDTSPYRSGLNALFRQFDSNNDGFITLDSLQQGLNAVLQYTHIAPELITSEALDELIVSIDLNEDHEVDYEEFFRAFGYGSVLIDEADRLFQN